MKTIIQIETIFQNCRKEISKTLVCDSSNFVQGMRDLLINLKKYSESHKEELEYMIGEIENNCDTGTVFVFSANMDMIRNTFRRGDIVTITYCE
jgi:hypothetical protein